MRIDYDSETCVGTGQLESLRSKLVGTQGVGRLSLVSQGRHKQLRWLKRLVGERGFEPPTPWSRNGNRNTILLIRLAWFCVLYHGFARFSAAIGLKLDSSFSA